VAPETKKFIAKIYKSQEKANQAYAKIRYMTSHSPVKSAPLQIQETIIWPHVLLFLNRNFIGYVMPYVRGGLNLEEMVSRYPLGARFGREWVKFDHDQDDAHFVRLKICYNLAQAINLLHRTGNYVLVDLKPQNIIIKPNGTFSIIDLDSIQIGKAYREFYPAAVKSDEYAPPEFHNHQIDFKNQKIPASWDSFSFAVIAYRILIGEHPFSASHARYNTIAEKISANLFVHGNRKNQLLKIPPVHKEFHHLSSDLKAFFLATFNPQGSPDKRPTLSQWTQAFYGTIKKRKFSGRRPARPKMIDINIPNHSHMPHAIHIDKSKNSVRGMDSPRNAPEIYSFQHPGSGSFPGSVAFQGGAIGLNPVSAFAGISKKKNIKVVKKQPPKSIRVQPSGRSRNTRQSKSNSNNSRKKPSSFTRFIVLGLVLWIIIRLLMMLSDGGMDQYGSTLNGEMENEHKKQVVQVSEKQRANHEKSRPAVQTKAESKKVVSVSESYASRKGIKKETSGSKSFNPSGKEIVYPPKETIHRVKNKQTGRYYFKGQNGRLITNASYAQAGDFYLGRARVKESGKWGYIDTQGNVVIDCIYETAGNFRKNFWEEREEARVTLNGEVFAIDKNGNRW